MDPIPCCIACGRYPEDLDWNMRALKEREDWKNLMKNPREDRSYMVKAEDIESMYFHKRPWSWACYYRASKKVGLVTRFSYQASRIIHADH
jgi:hypothetical protein